MMPAWVSADFPSVSLASLSMSSKLLEATRAWVVTSPVVLKRERVAEPASYQIGTAATDPQTSK